MRLPCPVWPQVLNHYFTIDIESSITKMTIDIADTVYMQLAALQHLLLPLMVNMGSLQFIWCQ